MFRNPNGKLVPHCEDCYFADKDCPDNAVAAVIDDYKGVAELPCFKPRTAENPDHEGKEDK